MSLFMLSQLLVFLALISDVISFQCRNRRTILCWLVLSALLIAAHFAMLESTVPAILMLLAALRFLVSIFSQHRCWMLLFMGLAIVATLLAYASWLDGLSLIGSVLQTRAAFCRCDKSLRQMMLLGSCFWLLNNLFRGSPAAVLMELVFIGSNLVGYYRFYLKKQPVDA